MTKPNPVRGFGPLDNLLANLRHGIAYRKLKSYQPLDRCLDIGSGAYPAFLISLDANEKVGLEQKVSEESAEIATNHQIRLVEHSVSDSSGLPFEDNMFDAVTMLAVIEHIQPSKVTPLLSEIYRVLKPGGVLFLTTPAAWTDPLLRTLAFLRLISREEIDDHKDIFTQQKLQKILKDVNFSDTRSGTFECLMNLWALANKPANSMK